MSEQQQPGSDLKPDRHSAPISPCNAVPGGSADKAQVKSSKKPMQMRHSLPAGPRKPLASVSNQELPLGKTPVSSGALSGSKRATSAIKSAVHDTLPVRKRKTEVSQPVRISAVRAAVHDDDDFV